MSGILENVFVKRAHGYTRSSEPWRLDADVSEMPVIEGGRSYCRRLFHYLSGGGMDAFRRTVRQEEAARRQNCFLIGFGIGFLVWLMLLVF